MNASHRFFCRVALGFCLQTHSVFLFRARHSKNMGMITSPLSLLSLDVMRMLVHMDAHSYESSRGKELLDKENGNK